MREERGYRQHTTRKPNYSYPPKQDSEKVDEIFLVFRQCQLPQELI